MSVIISGKYHNDDKRTKPHRKIVFFLVLSVFGLRVAGNLTFCDITILITLLFILLKGYKFSVSELIVPLVFVFLSSIGIIFVARGDLVEYVKDLLQISFYLISAATLSKYALTNFRQNNIFDSIIYAGIVVSLLGVLQYLLIFFSILIFLLLLALWEEETSGLRIISGYHQLLSTIIICLLSFSLRWLFLCIEENTDMLL
ncbi:hypothetical protein KPZU40_27530 [Klebsiella pneumoniae]|nr:hypothetical protein KPZU40_27530 [Klebsiella pneumoniae]